MTHSIKELFETNKRKFSAAVIKACDTTGFPHPTLSFDHCPDEEPFQLAHCHPVLQRICVSSKRLTKYTDTHILEVATREVAHLKVGHHSSDSSGHKEVMHNPKCNRHQCKKPSHLRCNYCGGVFCYEHYDPKINEQESYKHEGHVCIAYNRYLPYKYYLSYQQYLDNDNPRKDQINVTKSEFAESHHTDIHEIKTDTETSNSLHPIFPVIDLILKILGLFCEFLGDFAEAVFDLTKSIIGATIVLGIILFMLFFF